MCYCLVTVACFIVCALNQFTMVVSCINESENVTMSSPPETSSHHSITSLDPSMFEMDFRGKSCKKAVKAHHSLMTSLPIW